MARQATLAAPGKPGIVQRTQIFWGEVRHELSKVTWPSWPDLQVSTNVTMLLLAIMAVIIFLFDYVFQRLVLLLLHWAT